VIGEKSVLILFCYNFKSFCRAFPDAGAAGRAFKRGHSFGIRPHVVGGAIIHTDITAGTEFFVEHDDSLFVNREGVGRTFLHTGTALVADTQSKTIGLCQGEYLDTGFFRILLFEKKFGTHRYTGAASDTFFIIGF
jgi:hypothetical protein